MKFAVSQDASLMTVPDGARVTASVGIGPRSDIGFGLTVDLELHFPGAAIADVQKKSLMPGTRSSPIHIQTAETSIWRLRWFDASNLCGLIEGKIISHHKKRSNTEETFILITYCRCLSGGLVHSVEGDRHDYDDKSSRDGSGRRASVHLSAVRANRIHIGGGSGCISRRRDTWKSHGARCAWRRR